MASPAPGHRALLGVGHGAARPGGAPWTRGRSRSPASRRTSCPTCCRRPPCSARRRRRTARVGLRAGTPVVAGAADGPLGNLGTGAIDRGIAGLSLGTSGAVRMVVDGPTSIPPARLFCYALTAGVGGRRGDQQRRPRHPLGGRRAGARRRGGRRGDADEALLALAASAPGQRRARHAPLPAGRARPAVGPRHPGRLPGAAPGHTRAHLVRAAVEGVACSWGSCSTLDTVPRSTVRATGGAFRSPLWREVMAATLDRPLRPSAAPRARRWARRRSACSPSAARRSSATRWRSCRRPPPASPRRSSPTPRSSRPTTARAPGCPSSSAHSCQSPPCSPASVRDA